ncbi:phospholipase D-like domain-containing protein [Bacillus cereus]|nr:phospholipase D-like domain-containing protein [Bacillus cereus]
MLKEIPFQEGKVIFFKESNLWNDLLERCKKGTKSIYIATYNFNFRDRYEKTFYRELAKLADVGVDINLLYAKMNFSIEDKLEVEEIFKNFVLCAELPTNHSKLFITDDFVYIGSANFSFGSNNNYESGVIFNNKEIINEVTQYYCEELLDKSDFTNIPECFDVFQFIPKVLIAVNTLKKIESNTDLYSDIMHYIPELRFLYDIEEKLIALGYPIPVQFDWYGLYMNLYEKNQVPDYVFEQFKEYINGLSPYLLSLNDFIEEQYKSIGKFELLKKIGGVG